MSERGDEAQDRHKRVQGMGLRQGLTQAEAGQSTQAARSTQVIRCGATRSARGLVSAVGASQAIGAAPTVGAARSADACHHVGRHARRKFWHRRQPCGRSMPIGRCGSFGNPCGRRKVPASGASHAIGSSRSAPFARQTHVRCAGTPDASSGIGAGGEAGARPDVGRYCQGKPRIRRRTMPSAWFDRQARVTAVGARVAQARRTDACARMPAAFGAAIRARAVRRPDTRHSAYDAP